MGKINIEAESNDMIGPIVIEPETGAHHRHAEPNPIFFSKACRQLGIPSEAQPFVKDGVENIRARLPIMPKQTYAAILDRARFLMEREKNGLPTEQLPSGRWPSSEEEFADQVPLSIAKDEEKHSVYIDFGRPIQAIGISPAMARTVATLIMSMADELDPDGDVARNNPHLVNVARLQVPQQELEQEGTVILPKVFGALRCRQEEAEGGSENSLKNFPPVGLCEVCKKPQYMTPGGESCENGHGGAGTIRPCSKCIYGDIFKNICEVGHKLAKNNDDCVDWTMRED